MKTDAKRARELELAVETHRERLLPMIARRLRDQVEAEDVLQDVFEEFIETYDMNSAIESLSAWLVRVAQNKILDRFRRRKIRDEHRNDVLARASGGEAESPSRPDEEWTRLVLREEIVEALGLLPPEQREVFVAHELEGKSFEEISAETGVGVNTLLSRKRYAILFLREHLKEIADELDE